MKSIKHILCLVGIISGCAFFLPATVIGQQVYKMPINPVDCIDPLTQETVACEPPSPTYCTVPNCVPAGPGGCIYYPASPLPPIEAFFETSSFGGGSSIETYPQGVGQNLYAAHEAGFIVCYTEIPCICEIESGNSTGTCTTIDDFVREFRIYQWDYDVLSLCEPSIDPQ